MLLKTFRSAFNIRLIKIKIIERKLICSTLRYKAILLSMDFILKS